MNALTDSLRGSQKLCSRAKRSFLFRFLIFLLVGVLLGIHSNYGQQLYSYTFSQATLTAALTEIEQTEGVDLYYDINWLIGKHVNGQFESSLLENLLNQVLFEAGLTALRYNDYTYILIKELNDGQVIKERLPTGEETSKKIVGNVQPGLTNATVSGKVIDLENKRPLIGATLWISELELGTTSDYNGYYELELPLGEYKVEVNSLGYYREDLHIILQSSGEVDIPLVTSDVTLNEVTVSGVRNAPDISEGQMSKNDLEMEKLEYVPSLMGEQDIVKSINLLPGVISSEGSNGYSVRGGSFGQNLIFLESTPLYNPSHLFGLFSVFNPGVVERLSIYKGTMPPRFGGRVSSVMDIELKEGNVDEWDGEIAGGFISSRVSVEGPLAKKLSIVVGGRLSYFNRYLERIDNNDLRDSRGNFYDGNLKLTYDYSQKTTVSLNTFASYDAFSLPGGESISYGNQLASLNVSQKYSESLRGNYDLTFSNYSSTINSEDSTQSRNVENGIQTVSLRGYLSFFKVEGHVVNGGVETNFIRVDQGKINAIVFGEEANSLLPIENGLESAFFIGDEYSFNNKLTVNLGLRYSLFNQLGEGVEYTYQEGVSRQNSSIVDSAAFGKRQLMHSYGGLEPRVFINYDLRNTFALKFNMGRSRQFLHLMSNTASISPLNIWKLSSANVMPQVADQLSVGFFKKHVQRQLDISYEFFLRRINDMPDFKNGAALFDNPNLETEIVAGRGEAYGHEFQITKKAGKLTGWFSYTFSRSFNTVRSEIIEDQINEGRRYASNFDIPHSISVSGDYLLTRLWSLSFNWLYNTGRPITYPEASYFHNNVAVAYFSGRNAYRIPNYHRLDLSLNVKSANLKANKKRDYTVSFSVYNVYGRTNAYSVFFQRSGNRLVGKQLTILDLPVPSVNLTLKL